jgi:hypothetical protein
MQLITSIAEVFGKIKKAELTECQHLKTNIMNKNLFVFDCESTSLHGSIFAVGCIVADQKGKEIDRLELLSLEGKEKAGDWVKKNVIPNLQDMPTCNTDLELRNKFFDFYMKHKESSNIYSDVNYPVETNFLAAVVADDLKTREWSMPYPLFDIAMSVDINIDRCEKYAIETGKALRKHNPADDSIASLYCFLNCVYQCAKSTPPLKDKDLVLCCDAPEKAGKHIRFYDAKHECTFTSGFERDGYSFNYYQKLDPVPDFLKEWHDKAIKELEY